MSSDILAAHFRAKIQTSVKSDNPFALAFPSGQAMEPLTVLLGSQIHVPSAFPGWDCSRKSGPMTTHPCKSCGGYTEKGDPAYDLLLDNGFLALVALETTQSRPSKACWWNFSGLSSMILVRHQPM